MLGGFLAAYEDVPAPTAHHSRCVGVCRRERVLAVALVGTVGSVRTLAVVAHDTCPFYESSLSDDAGGAFTHVKIFLAISRASSSSTLTRT